MYEVVPVTFAAFLLSMDSRKGPLRHQVWHWIAKPWTTRASLRSAWRRCGWLLLVGFFFSVRSLGMAWGASTAFYVAYAVTAVVVRCLELIDPYRADWDVHGSSGSPADIVHTFATFWAQQLVVQLIARSTLRYNAVAWRNHAVACVCAVLVADCCTYWNHRWSHTVEWYWRFHALHHAPRHLAASNTGRFHFVNSFIAHALRALPLALLGFEARACSFYHSLTAIVGLLSHCNIALESGALCSHLFNTPENHRKHHSTLVEYSNANYGEILIVYDVLFGTFVDARVRVEDVGRTRYRDARGARRGARPFRLPNEARVVAQLLAPCARRRSGASRRARGHRRG